MTHKRQFIHLLLVGIFVCASFGAQAESAVYSPRNKSAGELLEAVIPLYDELKFSQYENSIIVRGDEAGVSDVIGLFEKLDGAAPRSYAITFLERAPQDELLTTSTRISSAIEGQSYGISADKPLIITKQATQRQLTSSGVLWAESRELPTTGEAVKIQLTPSGNGKVRLSYSYRTLRNQTWQTIANTIDATLGEWVNLFEDGSQDSSEIILSTTTERTESLYVMVKPGG